ncbi:hypothetical protein CRE_05853 [Caenorhabditis remanei]|uniref:Tyrosine-protein phosphatase domain-containing protein n=1 Tax=Caenorhabditis remanei TaxID=31234 RepID=E3MNQ3_CAERE|nr:hypothetical protein CRE_05853 [Caenorhabditis remanei]
MSYLLYALIVVVIILFIVVIVLLVRKRNQKDQHSDCKVVIPPSLFEYYVSNFLFRYTIFGDLYSSVMGTAAALKLFFLNLYTGDAAQPQTKSLHDHEPIEIPYRRADVPLALKGRLQVENFKTYNFETGYIHGNVIEYPNKLRVAITQAPHMADKKLGRKENIGMYYAAAQEQNCKLMICLTPTGGDQCAQYFPAEKGGKLKFMDGKLVVTCKKVEDKWDGAVARTLKVNFEGSKSFTMNHIQYEKWTGKVLPKKRQALKQILSEMENSAFPVFIHCTDGLHQSAVLAQVLMNKEQLSTKKELDYGLSLQELRNYRVDAITSGEEYVEAGILTFEYLFYNQITKTKNVSLPISLGDNLAKIQQDISAIDEGKTDGDVIEQDKIDAYNQKINLKIPEVAPEVKEEPKPEEPPEEKLEEKEDTAEEKRKKDAEERAKYVKNVEEMMIKLCTNNEFFEMLRKMNEDNQKKCKDDKDGQAKHDEGRKKAVKKRRRHIERPSAYGNDGKKGGTRSKDKKKVRTDPSKLPKQTSHLKTVDEAPLLDATQEDPAPEGATKVDDNMKTAGE